MEAVWVVTEAGLGAIRPDGAAQCCRRGTCRSSEDAAGGGGEQGGQRRGERRRATSAYGCGAQIRGPGLMRCMKVVESKRDRQ
eukprot:3145796-Rhodomonas_salina.1